MKLRTLRHRGPCVQFLYWMPSGVYTKIKRLAKASGESMQMVLDRIIRDAI